jgi:hypothetical protein
MAKLSSPVERENIGGFRNVAIVDLSTMSRIYLQFVPDELEYEPQSNIEAIASFGRNLPNYHFSGGEDTLKFEIRWVAQASSKNPNQKFETLDDLEFHLSEPDENLQRDVITRCKWLESLTKPNGYQGKLPEVAFLFGDMFVNAKWIVAAAPYKMSMFDGAQGLFPRIATQSITLKRVQDTNQTTQNILDIHS